MEKIKLTFDVGTTNADAALSLSVYLDQRLIFSTQHVTENTHVDLDIELEDGDHKLSWIMQGKGPEHTQLDTQGNILSDARLIIGQVSMDEIRLSQEILDGMIYTHDCNGSQPMAQHKFYREMGCNGTVDLDFSSPVYIWMLEKL